MIQAVRVFLQGGITASIALARRSPIIHLYSGGIVTDGPAAGSQITDVSTAIAGDVVELPGPITTPPSAPPSPADQNRTDWIPFFDEEEGHYVWYVLDQYVLGTINRYGGSINDANWESAKTAAIEQLLDPGQEPIFTVVNSGFTGAGIFPFRNCKSARIQVTGTTPEFLKQNIDGSTGYGEYMNVPDSGKVGWCAAGHGDKDTPPENLDWAAPQFLYFSNNRILFEPGM